MFHPSRPRKDLPKWPLRYRYNFARFTDHHGSRTGRPLIQRENVFFVRQVALLKSLRRGQNSYSTGAGDVSNFTSSAFFSSPEIFISGSQPPNEARHVPTSARKYRLSE
jgi:hypothetical protein